MRQYKVPALYDERPREFGGILTLRQVGYLVPAAVFGLPAALSWPGAVGVPVLVALALTGAALAFGRWQGLPADRALLLWGQYQGRPRRLVWQQTNDLR